MRILMTGASGLIGSAVASSLSSRHEVVTIGRGSTADIVADLSDPRATASLDVGQVDAMVHCAGVTDEEVAGDSAAAIHRATAGADALAGLAIAAGASKLAYVSSAHVYGPMTGHTDESRSPDPLSDYALSHFATEQTFKRRCSGNVSGVAMRPCAVYGELPDIDSFARWSLIPFSFPREAVLEGRITIRSSGEQRRNFVGTEDVAGAILLWIESNVAGWSIVNPLGELDATVFEFAQICADLARDVTGRECEVTRMPPDASTAGHDFDYATRSTMIPAERQSVRAALRNLMLAVLDQEG